MLVLEDRIKETTTTTGTGTVTLAGASTGFQSFAAIGNGNVTYYTIAGAGTSEWEVGIGTYTSSGTTLARTTVLASSNAGSLVNFSAGDKDVFVTYPADKAVYGNGTVLVAPSGTVLPLANGGTNATSAPMAMANLMGFTSTATSGGTTTLTNTSSYYQVFTGTTSSHTVVLPVTSTLQQGWTFHIVNNNTSSGNITLSTSGGNTLGTFPNGLTVMVTCIATGGTGIADWEFGYTDFSTRSGQGSVVLSDNPVITGVMDFRGTSTANSNFGTNITSGTISIGGTAGTGTITVGQSTVSQTTNIQAGATASGSTKTLNIGTGGLTGSTTAINIGSTVNGTSTTTVNGIFITPVPQASNGLVVNSNTVSASYSIPSGSSAMSAGPMTINSGITVTVPSGSRWVIL